MPITAREHLGNLVIDFGDGTDYTIYPVPGSVGIEIQGLLVGLALGTTAAGQGNEQAFEDTERLTKLALGIPTKKRKQAPNRRMREFEQMRQARQQIIAQAAILWNTGGGGIDAVHDLLNEAGGYPKALERVMASSGLGEQYKVLRAWLSGGDPEPSSEAAGTAPTTTPTGTANTSS